ncbi:MAG: hypothetical protein P0S96_03515 [Simkaniaceae bacterium]|nr:hypothetical protein [Candidatus Sacchlamyda saccharinae]
MVQVNSVGAAHSPQPAQPRTSVNPVVHSPLSVSSIAPGTVEEGGGILSSIWSSIKSVFSYIFCCFGYSSKVDGLAAEEKQELRDTFIALRAEFLSKKSEMTVENFKAWWTPKFSALSEKAQHLLMVEDMKGWARTKLKDHEDTVTEDMVTQHAESLCLDEDNRKKSLAFVRDLDIARASDGQEWNPMDNTILPTYFANIAKQMEASE